ncbi:hypothetical protein AX25_12800 [Listeria ivanovii WSLC3009]|nr:hypothetical protein AX25_12800 [Listeria ivanovii WSLC3009]
MAIDKDNFYLIILIEQNITLKKRIFRTRVKEALLWFFFVL